MARNEATLNWILLRRVRVEKMQKIVSASGLCIWFGLLNLACDRAAEGGKNTISPGDVSTEDRGKGINEGESREELVQRLSRDYEKFNEARAMSSQTPSICRELCDISTLVCESQEKLCDIAERNPSIEDSVNSCRWAKNQCSEVNEACINCTRQHQHD